MGLTFMCLRLFLAYFSLRRLGVRALPVLLTVEPPWEGQPEALALCDHHLWPLPAGVHAVCDCCGRRVAGGAGPHVLQRETGRKVSAGKVPVLFMKVLFVSGIHCPSAWY